MRSWPPEEEPSHVDTVPLLTPTMETDLLNEPWVFQESKTSVTKEDEKATSSIWEENFQDLSSYMDPFQGQCDFHTGESPTFKLSGQYSHVSLVTDIFLFKTKKDTRCLLFWHCNVFQVRNTRVTAFCLQKRGY